MATRQAVALSFSRLTPQSEAARTYHLVSAATSSCSTHSNVQSRSPIFVVQAVFVIKKKKKKKEFMKSDICKIDSKINI